MAATAAIVQEVEQTRTVSTKATDAAMVKWAAEGDTIDLEIALQYGPVETVTGRVEEIVDIGLTDSTCVGRTVVVDVDSDTGLEQFELNLLTNPVTGSISIIDVYLLRTDHLEWKSYRVDELRRCRIDY